MADSTTKSSSADPTLYLYTSLTAGSSHIITATSRLETILKANKIPFQAIDVATDEKARMLWGRRSKGRKLPGLVKFGAIIGDLEQIEEWNEYGELKKQIGAASVIEPTPLSSTPLTNSSTKPRIQADVPSTLAEKAIPKTPGSTPHIQIQTPPKGEQKEEWITLALRQASAEAAFKAKENARAKLKRKGTSGAITTPQKVISAHELSQIEPVVTGKCAGGDLERRNPVAPALEIMNSRRPLLMGQVVAKSTNDFHVKKTEALGLINHHWGSIISATAQDKNEVARTLQSSILTSQPLEPIELNPGGRNEKEAVTKDEDKDSTRGSGMQEPNPWLRETGELE